MLISTGLILTAIADPSFTNSEVLLFNEKQARDYVISQLEAKNQKLNELRAKEAELLAVGGEVEEE